MASFVPNENDGPDPKFVNSISSPQAPRPDQTAETMVKGISSLFESAVTGFDQLFETKAKDQVKDIAKTADTMFGNNAAVDAVAAGGNPTEVLGDVNASGEGVLGGRGGTAKGAPPGVDKLGARISSLDEAYRNGDLSNSKFQAWVEMETRKAVAAYPAYEDKIRAEVRSRLGGSPDALRKSLVADLDAKYRAGKTEADKVYAFITKESNMEAYAGYPGGPDQVMKDYHAGKISIEQIYGIPAVYHAQMGQFKLNDARIKFGENNRKVAVEQTTRNFNDFTRQHVDGLINNFLDSPDIKQYLEKAKNNPESITKDDIQAARAAMRHYGMQIDGDISLIMRGVNPRNPNGEPLMPNMFGKNGTGTPEAIMGEANVKSIIENSKRYYNRLVEMIDSGKIDTVSAARESSELNQKLRSRDMFNQDQYLLNDSVLEKTNPTLHKNTVNSPNYDKTVGEPWRNAGTRAFLFNIVTPSAAPPPTITEATKPDKNLTKSENDSLKSNIYHGTVATMLSPAMKGENFDRAAMAVFGPGNEDFLKNWTSNNHTNMYIQLTSEGFTKRMIEAGQRDPRLLAYYANWAERNVGTAMKGPIESLVAQIKADPRLQVDWDPTSMQMNVTNSVTTKLGQSRLPAEVERATIAMNATISNLKSVFEAAGKSPTILYDTLRAAGMNIDQAEADNAAKKPSNIDKTSTETNAKLLEMGKAAASKVIEGFSDRAGRVSDAFSNMKGAEPPKAVTPKGFTPDQFGEAMKQFPNARVDRQGRLLVEKDGKWQVITPKTQPQ